MAVEGPVPRGRGEMRASDADRDRVAEQLRHAAVEGRIGMDELDERLDAVYQARTYGELEPVTRDLPALADAGPPIAEAEHAGTGRWAHRIGGTPTSSGGFAVMSGFIRSGRWTIARRFTSFAFWGGGQIDLRDAHFAEREVVLRCVAVMGGVEIIVPPGLDVVVQGIGFMGGFGGPPTEAADPGAPRVIVKGFAFWGGVGVTRRRSRRAAQLERRSAKRDEADERDEADGRNDL